MDRLDRFYQGLARGRRWDRTGDPQDEPDGLPEDDDRPEVVTDDHELDCRRAEAA